MPHYLDQQLRELSSPKAEKTELIPIVAIPVAHSRGITSGSIGENTCGARSLLNVFPVKSPIARLQDYDVPATLVIFGIFFIVAYISSMSPHVPHRWTEEVPLK